MKKNKYSTDDKTILINTLVTFLVKGGSLLISFMTTPAYLRFFDNYIVLGLWFTLLSVLSWVLTFDLGIGNGLRNHLVAPLVEGDFLEAKKYISSAYASVGLIIVSISIPFVIVSNYIDWNYFFNIPTSIISLKSLTLSVVIVFLGIMGQFFLKLITSIFYSMQKSALNNFIYLLNSIVILGFVSNFQFSTVENKLIILSIVYSLSINIPLLLSSIAVFSTSLKNCRPNLKFVKKEYAKSIIKLGGMFFWIQIMYMVLTGTNEFLITWFVSPNAVVEYQIYNRVFSMSGTLFTLAITPFWSAITKAKAEGKYEWINITYSRLRKLAAVGIIGEFAVIPLLQIIMDVWLGSDTLEINNLYAVIFAIIGSINIWNSVLSTVANGVGELKPQAILFTIAVIIKIPLAWILVKIFDDWIMIVIANILSMSLYCVVQPILLSEILRKKLNYIN